jgi:hypothetical protein
MALTELIFDIAKAELGIVVLDASVRELHTASCTVTRHPIEAEEGSQSTVTDNVHVDPIGIQIEGIVSNHPGEYESDLDHTEQRVTNAHQVLLDNLLSANLITVKTTLLEYPNMVLENLQITRDAEKGNSLFLNATLSMVRLVTLEEVETGGTRPAGQSTKAKGKKGKKAAGSDASTGTQSVLSSLFG